MRANGRGGAGTRVIVDPVQCTGCRTCELACSLHHTGAMGTSDSSIRISRSNHTAAVGWMVEPSCDLCPDEHQPLCVKYCQLGLIRLEARP